MSVVVHHYHDEASTSLARAVAEALDGTALPEPVDNLDLSGIRVFDDVGQRWVLGHTWPRGAERQLDRELRQTVDAVRISLGGRVHEPPHSIVTVEGRLGIAYRGRKKGDRA